MKFIVSSSYLLKHLQTLGGIINPTNTLHILDNFLFELDKGTLKITASDAQTIISANLEVESDDKGSVAIPARLLLDILKTFPEQPLTFVTLGEEDAKKDDSTFESGQEGIIELASGQGKYRLAHFSGEEFPKPAAINSPGTTEIQGDVLATAISKTIFATRNDDMRPAMSGVLFQFTEKDLTFVATDAHRLVKYTRTDLKAGEPFDFIMPKKPLTLLKNILAGSEEMVKVEYSETNARFSFDETELICMLINQKYPNYEAVIPTDNPNQLLINREHFLSSVRRVSIFSNRSTHQVRLNIAGAELKVSAEDLDYSNKAKERLSCNYKGDDIEIGFNSRFLIEMLNNLESDEVSLEMSLPNRGGILSPADGLGEGEQILMLVMPVMISSS